MIYRARLSPDIADKFELAGGAYPGTMILDEKPEWGEYSRKAVDFRRMTLKEAEELVNLKDFPYLRRRVKRSWEK